MSRKRREKKLHQEVPASNTLNPSSDATNLRYAAAEAYRRDGIFVPWASTGEQATKRDRNFMVRIARDQYQNNPITRAIINGLVSECIGSDGAELLPTVDDPALKQDIKQVWDSFCSDCDYSDMDQFTDIERRMFTELLVVGEVLFIKRTGQRKLQMIESEAIRYVDVNDKGQTTAFYISPDQNYNYNNISMMPGTNDAGGIRIPARQAIWLTLKERVSQVRGAGILWSVFDVVNMLSFVLRSSAKAWALLSRQGLIINRENAGELGYQMSSTAPPNPTNDDTTPDSVQDRWVDFNDISVFFGKPGEKISAVDQSNIPNTQLGEHVLTFLRVISSVVGVDAATFVLQDWSKTSFSSSRAAHVSLTKWVKTYQNILTNRFYRPVARWLLGTAMDNGELPEERKNEILEQFTFVMPKPKMVDQEGEAKANQLEMNMGLTTYSKMCLERNMDPAQVLAHRKQEMIDAIIISQDIEKQTGVKVPYQAFCGLEISKSLSAVQEDNSSNKDASPVTETPDVNK